ncbi:peptidyl-prolyl cis-trans isomerase [Paenibacillus chartarius]|uniref:Peptidyl-prolyl cis-trans isomerase n=1 Tax=Paenibacillus chartarius TaxID=747481 RepID=A0ABV6DL67_9BACL
MNHTQTASRKWMIISSILLILLVVYVIAYPPMNRSASEDNSQAVAKVNGVTITSKQLYDNMVSGGGAQALDNMITNEIVSQEGAKAGVQVTGDDISKELESIIQQTGGEVQFQQVLESYGMTVDDLKQNLKYQVTLKKILEPQVQITDDQIKSYYNQNLESLKTPEQVKAAHIVAATKEEADAILADLKNGADFAAVAKEKSSDTSTKENGGDLGYVSKGQGEEAFDTAAFALQAGGLSDVVQTSSGYEVIKVSERKAASTPTLEEKKQEIHDTLLNEQISTMSSAWISEKTSAAQIEKYLS